MNDILLSPADNQLINEFVKPLLKDILKAREEFKAVQKEIKGMEKIDDDEYVDTKLKIKDLKQVVEDFEDQRHANLQENHDYTNLVELKVKLEENIAQLNEQLVDKIAGLPLRLITIEVDGPDGEHVRVQIQPEKAIYVNGRKEK